jgi:predicted ester cyclase
MILALQEQSMSNEDVVRAYVEAFNAADWRRIASLFTEDANIRGVLGWGALHVALPIWRELHENMRMRLRIDDIVVTGDKAAALLTETGSFQGPFRGLEGKEPTGRSYEIVAIEWFEFKAGRISRRWAARDSGAITRQLLA